MNDKKRKQKQSQQRTSLSWLLVAGAAALAVMALMLLTGCLKNDIPYPRIQPNFTEFEADGCVQAAEIDSASRIVTLQLAETTDIYAVDVTHYALSDGASIVNGNLDEPVDLSQPYIVTLKLYQEYDWVIRAKQNIDRYFTVEGQVGATIIDVVAHRVVVTVTDSPGVKAVKVLSQKLGPQGALESPDLTGQTIDLTEPYHVEVTNFGRTEDWEIYAKETKASVTTTRVDAWTQVAWVYGAAIEGRDNGVEYRQAGTESWTKAPAAWITHTGGTFYARLINLQPETQYEARAYSDSEYGAVIQFTTGNIPTIPNIGFEEWCKPGKYWCPWPEGGVQYWDTGNQGAATLGDGNVFRTTDTSTGTGYAALLQSKFIGIGVLGKFGAGSIFAGKYMRTDGTNGVLSFGQPFTQRPTKLRGYLKYKSVPIDYTNDMWTALKGQPDTCIVWCALIDSNEPFEIRTKPSDRHLFNENGPEVIAYGKVQYGETIPNYIPFTIELNYVSTQRVPKYILIVSSASKYGDYFTGGNGSELYLDGMELLYDY